MAKVHLLLHLCHKSDIKLENKNIFDYGFGAGTFFRYCPPSSTLAGVEIDPENVNAVRAMLASRGVRANLQSIEVDKWSEHPVLDAQYDVIIASHVMEHLREPSSFLETIAHSIKKEGVLLGLVPLNERKMDPHHVQRVDRAKIFQWAETAGWRVDSYMESDPWLFWVQPFFALKGRSGRFLAQAMSLAVGAVATALGPQVWFGSLADSFAAMTRSHPTQAAFVLKRG